MYSTRVSFGYRALGLMEDADITWFWIGRTLSAIALLTSCNSIVADQRVR